MKYCRMNGPSESEVESLLLSPCWGPPQAGGQDQYLLDGHKLLLEHELDSLPSPGASDSEPKGSSLDVLDNLLLSELKPLPLPPFTGYTGHLSINGISGHHYHAIAQRLPDESNNNYMQSAYHTHTHAHSHAHTHTHTHNHHQQQQQQQQQPTHTHGHHPAQPGGGGASAASHHLGAAGAAADHNLVSSSTGLPESVLGGEGGGGGPADACLGDVKLFDGQLEGKLYSVVADSCAMGGDGGGGGGGGGGGVDPVQTGVRIYTDAKDLSEYVDMNSIDDIAAIIGSAIADTTVPNQLDGEEGGDTRDSWMDLDAWIDGNCIQQDGKLVVSQQDAFGDLILPHSPVHSSSSTLQSLLTHGYMPMLHHRLQNGPPQAGGPASGSGPASSSSAVSASGALKGEAPSSTSYCGELTSTSSPPGSVVSTTADSLQLSARYLGQPQPQSQPQPQPYQVAAGAGAASSSALKADGLCSPDMLGNYPHTTTGPAAPPGGAPKAKRSRSQKKGGGQQQQQQHLAGAGAGAGTGAQQMNAISPSSVSYGGGGDLSGLLGKEKPVHRCSICNRGFLNKSNIKVHLRTHTGEKPFRCEVCAKAFRQKAHLLKHQQIHKRIGRD